jgi:hypothetical protein
VVRDPPRKSEQATHWAVRLRRARRARCRSRESTACTEWRLRNDRRRHRFRIHGPQRERQRLLGVSGSGGQYRARRVGGRSQEAFLLEYCHRKGRRSQKKGGGTRLRTPSLWLDCNKRATVAHSRWIVFEVTRRGMEAHKYSDGSRLAGVGQNTHGQPRYLFALPDCWSRYFFLLTRALQHSLYPLDRNTICFTTDTRETVSYV